MVVLKRRFKIAKIANLSSVASIHEYKQPEMTQTQKYIDVNVSKAELTAFHKSYGFKIDPELSEDQFYEALWLLHRYKSVFARDINEIKEFTGPPLTLELHTDRKMFKRQYRFNEVDKAEVNRQIDIMEKATVIEPSDTPYYNSPTYLVAKKNGSKRLVVDLRGINSLVRPKLVQLPQIEELLDEITSKNPRFSAVSTHFLHSGKSL